MTMLAEAQEGLESAAEAAQRNAEVGIMVVEHALCQICNLPNVMLHCSVLFHLFCSF